MVLITTFFNSYNFYIKKKERVESSHFSHFRLKYDLYCGIIIVKSLRI